MVRDLLAGSGNNDSGSGSNGNITLIPGKLLLFCEITLHV